MFPSLSRYRVNFSFILFLHSSKQRWIESADLDFLAFLSLLNSESRRCDEAMSTWAKPVWRGFSRRIDTICDMLTKTEFEELFNILFHIVNEFAMKYS